MRHIHREGETIASETDRTPCSLTNVKRALPANPRPTIIVRICSPNHSVALKTYFKRVTNHSRRQHDRCGIPQNTPYPPCPLVSHRVARVDGRTL